MALGDLGGRLIGPEVTARMMIAKAILGIVRCPTSCLRGVTFQMKENNRRGRLHFLVVGFCFSGM